MSVCGRRLSALLGLAVLSAALPVPAQRLAFEQQLEEAKVLYRQGSFQEAILKLQDVVSELKPLREVEVRKAQLADAYLHLGLAYVAVGERVAGKEALKAMLRLDPERRLDPDIYAPKVIALCEEARAEVRAEPSALETTSAPTPRQGHGSKTLPFVLGAGAAAIGGVALAVGGGGSQASGPAATAPSPSPTPTPTPLSGPTDVAFVDSAPAPGSSLSLGGGVIVTARLTYVSGAGGTYSMNVYLVHVGAPVGGVCLVNYDDFALLRQLAPGQPQTFEHPMRLNVVSGACPALPADAIGFRVLLRSFPENTIVLDKQLAVGYRLVP